MWRKGVMIERREEQLGDRRVLMMEGQRASHCVLTLSRDVSFGGAKF